MQTGAARLQSHRFSGYLAKTKAGEDSVFAIMAIRPKRKAIIFVHGYSGDALETWFDFPALLTLTRAFEGHDLFFYAYDGLRADLIASAGILREFLARFLARPTDLLNAVLPAESRRPSSFVYDEIILAAHSLGAVMARRALLDATELNLVWARKSKLVLFAPAHMGANVVALALETLSGIPLMGMLAGWARLESPLIDQLKPGSLALTNLLKDTERLRLSGEGDHVRAKSVIIAQYEKIVENSRFGDDPPPIPIAATNHMSVCKPRSDFLRPVELLEECL